MTAIREMTEDQIRKLNREALEAMSERGLESFSIPWWPAFTRYVIENAPLAAEKVTADAGVWIDETIRTLFGCCDGHDLSNLQNERETLKDRLAAPSTPSPKPAVDAPTTGATEGEPVDYDRVVSICEAHGIGLPVDCIEMVVEIIRHAIPHPASEPQSNSVPLDCDVRKILLRVVPGDGDGHEVYAKNVGEVESLLSEMGERLEDFESAYPASEPKTLTKAARDVFAERERHVTVEGWTPEHDDQHANDELSLAAACYALEGVAPYTGLGIDMKRTWQFTGWDWSWWKPKGRRSNLVKAAALLLAEIERIDRGNATASEGEQS